MDFILYSSRFHGEYCLACAFMGPNNVQASQSEDKRGTFPVNYEENTKQLVSGARVRIRC